MSDPTPTVPAADLRAEVYEFIADSASESEPLARQCPGFIVALRSEAERLRASPPRGGDGAGDGGQSRECIKVGDYVIWPAYVPPFPFPDTCPIVAVQCGERYLRYSRGPRTGTFWDTYPDDFQSVELAREEIAKIAKVSETPPARRAQPIPGAAECSCFSITCAVHGAALYRQPPPAPAPVEPPNDARHVPPIWGLVAHRTLALWCPDLPTQDKLGRFLAVKPGRYLGTEGEHLEVRAYTPDDVAAPPATGEVGALLKEERGWPSIIEYNDDLSKTDRRTIANLMRRMAPALAEQQREIERLNTYWRGEIDRADKQHTEALVATRREVDLWTQRATAAEAALATALKERDAWAKTSAACEIALERRVESLTTSLDQARAERDVIETALSCALLHMQTHSIDACPDGYSFADAARLMFAAINRHLAKIGKRIPTVPDIGGKDRYDPNGAKLADLAVPPSEGGRT